MTTLMFGWEALKSPMTCWNAFCWLGSSPPPRQQNQRIWIGPPGGTVAGPVDGGPTDAEASAEGALLADGVAALLPHALASRAIAANRMPGRDRRACMAPPPDVPLATSAAAGRRWG